MQANISRSSFNDDFMTDYFKNKWYGVRLTGIKFCFNPAKNNSHGTPAKY